MSTPLAFTDASLAVPWLPGTEAVQMVADGGVLIDLRSLREVAATGIAQGAMHIPMPEFGAAATPGDPAFVPALRDGRPVILYCATGVRSQIAGGFLMSLGHPAVWNLGGLREWIDGGGALRRSHTHSRW
mgnify:CR=1 FL=1